jgi:type IVB pilus formation R64 PilN family outer membrane protein
MIMVKISRVKLLAILLLASVSLTGCYGEKVKEHIMENVDHSFEEIKERIEESKLPSEAIEVDTVSETDELFLGDESVILSSGKPLPKELEGDYGITFSSKEELDIFSFANKLYYLTGLKVRLDSVDESLKGENFQLSYTGSLSGLLNLISNEIGVYWEYTGNEIVLYKRKTKIFALYALSTSSDFSTSVSASSGGGSVSSSSTFDAWTEVEQGLNDIIKTEEDDKSSITISKSTGTISVTSSPDVIKKIGQFIRIQNERFSRQVVVAVKIMQVSLNDGDSMGINFQLLHKDLNFKGISGTGAVSNGSGIQYMIGNTDKAGDGHKVNSPNIDAVVAAISKQGRTSLLTSAVLTTINNKVVPFNNLKKYKYVSEIKVVSTESGSETEVQTDEIEEGFSIQLLPNILDNGRLLMMFNLSYTELISLDTVSSTGSEENDDTCYAADGTTEVDCEDDQSITNIQLPTIEERSFLQELVLRSGQTVVLTGFEKVKNENTNTGLGDPNFIAAGGSRVSNVERDVLVVLITPQVINSPLHPNNRALEGSFLR